MIHGIRGDGGSSLPIFVWLAGVVLFAAFAFFAFAQAAVARNGAQSAADAAALAAAQEAREGLIEGLLLAAEEGDSWDEWLDGRRPHGMDARGAADVLAARNQAAVVQFGEVEVRGDQGFSVEVRASEPVGDSVIPATGGMHAKATAVAVVSPRCEISSDVNPAEQVSFHCPDGVNVDLDVGDVDQSDLPDPSELFLVHLAG
ncbi:pilus assembly protein TadG-related protein [Streptomyces sp. SID8014]|uniref:pilus assembly protein TadG-related protein n=1 Tax=Streptomyces sp. SID8014 TaxID=2706097 RepID=UPI001EF2A4D8|nr:pilus assembly protein TadG-related protein [Streptomyces sp. SID8014]